MLEAVADQFAQINQRLETQLTRIAQLQQQLDQQQKDINETRADVTRIRGILEGLVATPPSAPGQAPSRRGAHTNDRR